MRRSDFHYDLPPERIAQAPASPRSASRLLDLTGTQALDSAMADFPARLRAGDLLVFNDTRVIPARLHGVKDSGGKAEVLVERLLDDHEFLAQVRASKPPRPGGRLVLGEGRMTVEMLGREGEFFRLRSIGARALLDDLRDCGEVPLPPYISRHAGAADAERYQTVFARTDGAVAAPTAGLHFDEALLRSCRDQGVDFGYVTLHVGAGTFQPMRAERLEDHVMHSERLSVSSALCEQIEATRRRGGRVVAVGTTVVRALETAAKSGALNPFEGETRLFITPGYRFRVVDALLTNFHLPESTLLMLVCAFGGHERVMAAYRHAVAARYRFFSYGDAMWLTPHSGARSD